MSLDELAELEEQACPGCGSCAACSPPIHELFDRSAWPRSSRKWSHPRGACGKDSSGKKAGMKVMELVSKDIRPRQIATLNAFKNALAVDMALGCSTNTVLHVPAIAREAGITIDLDLFDQISSRTPHICALSPGGPNHLEDLDAAGACRQCSRSWSKVASLTRASSPSRETHWGKPGIRSSRECRGDSSPGQSTQPCSGIAIMRGNLAPDGAVVKQARWLPPCSRTQAWRECSIPKKQPLKQY